MDFKKGAIKFSEFKLNQIDGKQLKYPTQSKKLYFELKE